jgi:DNA-binding transcriptional LysR family regulator
METQLLRTFVTVAETGSISSAAVRLGYVQSSVSEQLRRLERELGARLLTRTSTGVSPTSAGRRLLPDAERVLAALDDLRRTTIAPERLRVGAVDTLAVGWLPAVVAALPADERPMITMDRRDLLLRTLIDGRCDVVILYRPSGAPLPHLGPALQAAVTQLQVEVLDTDELLVVSAPDRDTEDGWLVTQIGCVHREIFDRHVASPRIQAQAATPDALRRLARQGAGRALLPALAIADDLADGGLVIDPGAPDVAGSIEIVAVYHADAPPQVHRFLRRAVDHALRPRA